MVKSMCSEAGIQGNKTNHSLRATGASRLFVEKTFQRKSLKKGPGIEVTMHYVFMNAQHQLNMSLFLKFSVESSPPSVVLIHIVLQCHLLLKGCLRMILSLVCLIFKAVQLPLIWISHHISNHCHRFYHHCHSVCQIVRMTWI